MVYVYVCGVWCASFDDDGVRLAESVARALIATQHNQEFIEREKMRKNNNKENHRAINSYKPQTRTYPSSLSVRDRNGE